MPENRLRTEAGSVHPLLASFIDMEAAPVSRHCRWPRESSLWHAPDELQLRQSPEWTIK